MNTTLELIQQALAAAKAAAPTRTTTATHAGTTDSPHGHAKSGAAPTKSGSIARVELPPALPPAPSPARRAPKGSTHAQGNGAESGCASPSQASPGPLVHPDDGRPLGKACKPGANAALWASMPRINRRSLPLGGDQCANARRIGRIAKTMATYMQRGAAA